RHCGDPKITSPHQAWWQYSSWYWRRYCWGDQLTGGEDVECQDVVINGDRYFPESSFSSPWFSKPGETPRVGIAITTFRRPEMLKRTIREMEGKLPEGAVKVVVDDGSAKPVSVPEGWI